jgi:SAM-dependent methyltransferase
MFSYSIRAECYKPGLVKARPIMTESSSNPAKIKSPASANAALDQWYSSPLGHYLASEIRDRLDDLLSTSFGYYTVHLGCQPSEVRLLEGCRTKHVFHLGQCQSGSDAEIDLTSLPVATDSTDLVVLVHALSQSRDPHALLREVNRVLIPDGKLIIVDFNPVSLWGLRHLFQSWLDEAPWGGHYYTTRRIKDWTGLLGFDLLHSGRAGYVLPLNFQKLLDRSRILAKFSARWLSFSGALNILEFQKNTIPLTPFKRRWARQRILSPKVVRPTVGRGMKYGK